MKEQVCYLCCGLPSSGKSTWAKEFIQNNNHSMDIVRINNDDIREALFGRHFEWSPKLEEQVKKERIQQMKFALERGWSIIVDNTHLNPKTLEKTKIWIQQNFPDVNIVLKDFRDVPVEECIRRDNKRRENPEERAVGEQVILKMAKDAGLLPKPMPNPVDEKLPWCIICDLDGTLALFGDRRNAYDASNCHVVDEPNRAILGILKTYLINDFTVPPINKIFLFSGRSDVFQPQTIKFLEDKCRLPLNYINTQLVMRSSADSRPDTITKKEMYDKYIKGQYNVHCVFDDRPSVLKMWRSLGLPVFDCGDGWGIDF